MFENTERALNNGESRGYDWQHWVYKTQDEDKQRTPHREKKDEQYGTPPGVKQGTYTRCLFLYINT